MNRNSSDESFQPPVAFMIKYSYTFMQLHVPLHVKEKKNAVFSQEMSFTHFISGHNINKSNPCILPLASFSKPQTEKADKKNLIKHDDSQS